MSRTFVFDNITLILKNPSNDLDIFYTEELVDIKYSGLFNQYKIDNAINQYINSIKNFYDLYISIKNYKKFFINNCDSKVFHKSELTGVYEIVNPNINFYVYKTTASNSNKYYYGVRQIKKYDPQIMDCLEDHIFGSGSKNIGNKFYNWKNQHIDFLKKEILEIFDRRSLAYAFEREIVGDKWRSDFLCLNSCPGGMSGGMGTNLVKISIKNCPIHGEVKHIGGKCYNCFNGNTIFKNCTIHGVVAHIGELCCACRRAKHSKIKNCKNHGMTIHYGDDCCKCHTENSITLINCSIHGEVKHIGDKCYKCINDNIVKKECKIHGLVKFRGKYCLTCKASKNIFLKDCPIHGESKHIGNQCYKCISLNNKKYYGKCSLHGDVQMTINGNCYSCRSEKIAHNRFHTDFKDNCRYCGS